MSLYFSKIWSACVQIFCGKMRKVISLLTLVICVVIPGCRTAIQLPELITKQVPFNLSRRSYNSQTGLSNFETLTIEVNSHPWNLLTQFIHSNEKGWQKSQASYLGDAYVMQGDFKLIYTKGVNAVVLNFKDPKGKPKQFVKKIQAGELDFLFEL